MYLPAASGNDYQKERQFKKINSQKDSIEVPAVRSGKQIVLKNTDVLVGDVLLLNTGDKVTSADATLLTHAFSLAVLPSNFRKALLLGDSGHRLLLYSSLSMSACAGHCGWAGDRVFWAGDR